MEVCVSEESNSPPIEHTSSTVPSSSKKIGQKTSIPRQTIITRSGNVTGSGMNDYADLVHESFYRGPKIDDFDIADLR